MNNLIEFGRIAQSVRAAAARRGLKGDPFCEVPEGMFSTAGAECLAHELYLEVPQRVRRTAPSLAQKMARSIVYSATQARRSA